MRFFKTNRFALVVFGAWLVVVWTSVLATQAYFGHGIHVLDWAGNWDGAWYRSIVESGYQTGPITHQVNEAFFPLYPLTTWLVKTLTFLPTIWAGIVVSCVCFGAVLVWLHKLVRTFFTRRLANLTVLLLVCNPFSYYFAMTYTESLFLLLAVGTFWFIYKGEWWRAALFAGLASATRSVGIALSVTVVGAVLWREAKKMGWHPMGTPKKFLPCPGKNLFWGDRGTGPLPDPSSKQIRPGPAARSAPKTFFVGTRQKSFWELPRRASPLVFRFASIAGLSFSGLILFSLYLWHQVGDPVAYKHAQEFWPGRGGIPNVGNEIMYLLAHKQINLEYAITAMWYGCTIVAFVGAVLLVKLRLRLMAVYAFIALSLPIIFGTAASLNRYAMVVFPVFLAYGKKLPKWAAYSAISVGGVGLVIAIVVTASPRNVFLG